MASVELSEENDRGPNIDLRAGMPLKIGVMGEASGAIAQEYLDRAHEVGRVIAQRRCIVDVR
jgi:hypothetical protein